MADDITKATIFAWLVGSCFGKEQIGGPGGALRLCMEEGGVTETIRQWTVQPVTDEDATARAKVLSEEIANAAELACSGRGGGKRFFVVRALPNGSTRVVANCPFKIELESDGPIAQDEPTGKGLIAFLMKQNSDLHQTMVLGQRTLVEGMKQLTEMQGKLLEAHSKLALDNFVMLRANVENQVGREAEAFATAQKSEDIRELMQMVMQLGVPKLLEAFAKKDEAQS